MATPINDNADQLYDRSRRAEVAANREEISLEEVLAQMPPPQAPAASQSTPETPQDAPERDFFRGQDLRPNMLIRNALSGVAKNTADAADNALALSVEALQGLGWGPALALDPEQQAGVLREGVDALFGEAESGVAELTEEVAGIASLFIPTSGALKAAGVVSAPLRGVAAGTAGTTAATNPNDATAAEVLEDFGVDNAVVQFLSPDTDDSTAERLLKTSIQETLIGAGVEKLLLLRAARKARKAQRSAAELAGVDTDNALEAAADDVLTANGSRDQVQEAVGHFTEAEDLVNNAARPRPNLPGDELAGGFQTASPNQLRAIQEQITDPAKARFVSPPGEDDGTRLFFQRDGAGVVLQVGDDAVDIQGLARSGGQGGAAADSVELAEQVARANGKDKITLDFFEFQDEAGKNVGPGDTYRKLGFRETDRFAYDPAQEPEGLFAAERPDVIVMERPVTPLAEAGEAAGDAAPLAPRADLDLTDAALDTPGVSQALNQRATEADEALAQAQRVLASAAESTGADGRTIEALRQTLRDAGASTDELDRLLGAAADRNVRPPVPKGPLVGDFLQVTQDQLDAIEGAAAAGDWDALTDGMSEVYDSTNYERIAEEGIEPMLRAFGQMFGRTKNSTRLLEVEGLAQTEAKAQRIIDRQAAQSFGSPERLTANLQNLMPDLDNLAARVNAIRMYEVSLSKKLRSLVDSMPTEAAERTAAQKAEFGRWSVLLANVNDIRAGVASNLGRALGSLRIDAKFGTADDILAGAQAVRDKQINDVLQTLGGGPELDKLIDLVRIGGDPDAITATVKLAVDPDSATIGDVTFTQFISNILSSGNTQAMNIGSNLGKALLWSPKQKLFAAGGQALVERNPAAFKSAMAHTIASYKAAVASFRVAGHLGESRVRKAFRTGQRITAGDNVSFIDDEALRTLLRPRALGRVFQNGLPLRVPFSTLAGRPTAVPLAGPRSRFNPVRGMTDRIGNALDANHGWGAKAVDYYARVMEWPSGMLAAGDEWAASINYQGQLAADITDHVQHLGLSPDATAAMVRQLEADAPRVRQLARQIDPNDAEQVEYLKLLDTLNANAEDFARRGTFTEQNLPAADLIMEARRKVPALKWFIPFVRTPFNVFKQGLTEMSFGPPTQALKAAAMGNKTEAAREAGKTVALMGLYGSVWDMVTDGRLVGSGPMDARERELWQAEDPTRLPYSIKIGDKWVSYQRLDPFAIPVAMLADAIDVISRMDSLEEEDKLHGEILGRLRSLLSSKSYLEGLTRFVTVLESGNERNFQDHFTNFASNIVVPLSRFWASVERGGLPFLPDDLRLSDDMLPGGLEMATRLVEGRPERTLVDRTQGPLVQLADRLEADLPPGASEAVGALGEFWLNTILGKKFEQGQTTLRDLWYEPRLAPAGLGPNMMSFLPVDPRTGEAADPVSAEMARLNMGVSVSQMFGEYQGIKLRPSQQDRLHQLTVAPPKQPNLRELIAKIMFNEGDPDKGFRPGYLKLGDTLTTPTGEFKGSKEAEIRALIQTRLRNAGERLMAEDPEIRQQVLEQTVLKEQVQSQEGFDQVNTADKRKQLFDELFGEN